MKLQTDIPLKKSRHQIGYQSQILILGSCFAENIGRKLDYFKFQNLQNPFGILFHTLAIENLLLRAIEQKKYTAAEVFFANERWHCFDAHSDLSHASKETLLQKLNTGLEATYQHLGQATHIYITLGTAWVYRHKKSKNVVSNCHKIGQNEFSKELLSSKDVQLSLEKSIALIQALNKNARFIFTVSPVRHLKDGYIENQRSKAHLIAAVHQMMDTSYFAARISYFESYELMMDELRDYRFYDTDMIHPNQLAIAYIWEKFVAVWLSPSAHPIMEKVDRIQKGLKHRPFNPDSEGHGEFLKSLETKITYLEQRYPFMKF